MTQAHAAAAVSTLDLRLALAIGAALALFTLIGIVMAILRASRARREEAVAQSLQASELEGRIGELTRLQAEMAGRVFSMGDMLANRQSELAHSVGERLDAVTHRLGQSLDSTTRHTTESLRHLHERLALIDNAQKNLSELTTQVTSLREVLSNKQARGAFGQGAMEAIVSDALPKDAYAFQFTLSNNTRPDCAVFLPDKRPLVIDAKFPLEAITALKEARNDDDRKRAAQRLRQDIGRHVSHIADKYLIPGETHELALMFVPSESVYAELHDGFDDVVQKAHRARVMLVSPTLLVLAIQVVQQIQKDARMRDAAHKIQSEVVCLLDDVVRLRDRVVKLEKHFGVVNEDIRQIVTSSDKIDKRGTRIRELDFSEDSAREAGRDGGAVVIKAPMRAAPARPRLQLGD